MLLLLLLLLLVDSLSGPSVFIFQSSGVPFFKFPAVLISILKLFFLSFQFQLLGKNYQNRVLLNSARHFRPEVLWPSRSGQRVITARHSISKCSIESVVYPASLRTAQEKLHETPCLLQRSARLRPDLK